MQEVSPVKVKEEKRPAESSEEVTFDIPVKLVTC